MRTTLAFRTYLLCVLIVASGLGLRDAVAQSAPLAQSAAAAQSAASCDNACLKGFVDGYIDALSHRDATKLPVAKEVKYTENGRVLDLGEGFWHTAGAPIPYRDYILDPSTGSVAVSRR